MYIKVTLYNVGINDHKVLEDLFQPYSDSVFYSCFNKEIIAIKEGDAREAVDMLSIALHCSNYRYELQDGDFLHVDTSWKLP